MILLVLVVLGVFVIGVYKFDWQGPLTRKFLSLIPLPVAVVNGRPISLTKYWDLKVASERALSNSMELDTAVRSGALRGLIQGELVKQMARERRVEVRDAEVSQYYRYLLGKFGIAENASAWEISNLFGLSEREFLDLVVIPDLQYLKLKMWWQETSRPNVASRRIQEAAGKIREGMSFEEVAQIYSNDEESKYIGGDLGFEKLSELAPWLATGISGLEASSTSGVIVSPEGYDILQVASKAQDEGEPRLHLRQIFVKGKGFEEFFEREKARFRILVFKKI